MNDLQLFPFVYRPDQKMAAHEHERSVVCFVLSGGVHERVRRQQEDAAVGSFVLHPQGTVHEDVFAPSGSLVLSATPSSAANDWWLRRSMRWQWFHGFRAAQRTFQIATDWRGDAFGAVEESLCELLASQDAATPKVRGPPPRRLSRIRDRVLSNPEVRPSVRQMAQEEGLHPVYLTRCFRKAYGASISEYVRRVRIQLAAGRIAGGAQPLAELAIALGFSDQSHFCRAFRREMGITPMQYSRLVASRD